MVAEFCRSLDRARGVWEARGGLAGRRRGHVMAMVHVITKGPTISDKHVGTSGSHADASTELWLDGRATDPSRS